MNHCKKWTLGSYNQQRGFYEPTPCNDKFDTVREGTQETITRPAFRAGTVIIKDYTDVKLPTDIRSGLGNYTLIRENFVAPPLMPRVAVDFDKLNAQDLEAEGIKVQLGAKTIEQLFKTYVKDNTDVEWLNEYRRRRTAGETSQQLIDNPPFGREQRKVSKMTNFAESPQTAGFTHRIFTIRQYRAQQGLINLFLLSNVDQNRSLEEPLLSSQPNGSFVPMKISSMVTALGRPGAGVKYLDIETRTVITQAEAFALANAGVDNGQIDDQDPPGGKWV